MADINFRNGNRNVTKDGTIPRLYINHHENGHRECIYFTCIAGCNARLRLARLWGIKLSSDRILGISELSLSCRSGNNVIVYHTENHTGLLSCISIWCKCQSRSYPKLQIKETTPSYGWVHFTILMQKDNTLTYLFTISLSIMSCTSSQQLRRSFKYIPAYRYAVIKSYIRLPRDKSVYQFDNQTFDSSNVVINNCLD